MNPFREIAAFAVGGVLVVFAIAILEHFGKVSAGNSQIILVLGSNMVTAAITRWTDNRTSRTPTFIHGPPPDITGKGNP